MGSDAFLVRGRELQRYEKNRRLVAGCIPYRVDHGANLRNRVQVLMISTSKRNDLIFPKGGWDSDETMEEAACREAFEEAGVKGIVREMLGVWEFRSKSSQKLDSQEGWCRGSMLALEVTEELPFWPEQACHERKWLSIDNARALCRYPWMQEALNKFQMLLSEHVPVKPELSMFRCTQSTSNERIDNPINALC